MSSDGSRGVKRDKSSSLKWEKIWGKILPPPPKERGRKLFFEFPLPKWCSMHLSTLHIYRWFLIFLTEPELSQNYVSSQFTPNHCNLLNTSYIRNTYAKIKKKDLFFSFSWSWAKQFNEPKLSFWKFLSHRRYSADRQWYDFFFLCMYVL